MKSLQVAVSKVLKLLVVCQKPSEHAAKPAKGKAADLSNLSVDN